MSWFKRSPRKYPPDQAKLLPKPAPIDNLDALTNQRTTVPSQDSSGGDNLNSPTRRKISS